MTATSTDTVTARSADASTAAGPAADTTATVRTAKRANTRLNVAATERRHVPKPSGKPDPTAHLSAAEVEALARELDALRQEVLGSRGAGDAAYIRKVIDVQRKLELGSRAVLLFSLFPAAWLVGTAGLAVAKILENMEIGHNVMHGQWDWMRDPKIHSAAWEWDHASPAVLWKRSHNEVHHTYTNVLGRDNDLGYGIMRVDEDQRWVPMCLGQPLWNFVTACIFEYGIAAHDLGLGKRLRGRGDKEQFRRDGKIGAPQDRAADAQGLPRPPAAVGALVLPHRRGERHRQPDPQLVGAFGHHVRPLPRGCRDLRQDLHRRRDAG